MTSPIPPLTAMPSEIAIWLQENGPLKITFNAKSADMEEYPEENIEALLTAINMNASDPEVCTWSLDYSPFEVRNALIHQHNYYDKCSIPRLAGPASGHYTSIRTVYMAGDQPWGQYIQSAEYPELIATMVIPACPYPVEL